MSALGQQGKHWAASGRRSGAAGDAAILACRAMVPAGSYYRSATVQFQLRLIHLHPPERSTSGVLTHTTAVAALEQAQRPLCSLRQQCQLLHDPVVQVQATEHEISYMEVHMFHAALMGGHRCNRPRSNGRYRGSEGRCRLSNGTSCSVCSTNVCVSLKWNVPTNGLPSKNSGYLR